MTYDELIAHFGGVTKTAKALGLTRDAVHKWAKRGSIPESRLMHVEALMAKQTVCQCGKVVLPG